MDKEQQCKIEIEEINVLMRPMLAELKKLRDIKRPITEKLRTLSRQREKDVRDERKKLKAEQSIKIIHLVVRDLQGAWFKIQYGVESTNHFSCPTWQITKDIKEQGMEAALQQHKPTLELG